MWTFLDWHSVLRRNTSIRKNVSTLPSLPFTPPDYPLNSWLNVTVIYSLQLEGCREFFIIHSLADAKQCYWSDNWILWTLCGPASIACSVLKMNTWFTIKDLLPKHGSTQPKRTYWFDDLTSDTECFGLGSIQKHDDWYLQEGYLEQNLIFPRNLYQKLHWKFHQVELCIWQIISLSSQEYPCLTL